MTLIRTTSDYAQWPKVAKLIHDAFAYMEPILGHPPRAIALTPDDLAAAATKGTVFLIADQNTPVASLFTRPSRDFENALYLGWLAVRSDQRGRGLARQLMNAAERESRSKGFQAMTLDTGQALTDLHKQFVHLGFQPTETPDSQPIVSFLKPLN